MMFQDLPSIPDANLAAQLYPDVIVGSGAWLQLASVGIVCDSINTAWKSTCIQGGRAKTTPEGCRYLVMLEVCRSQKPS